MADDYHQRGGGSGRVGRLIRERAATQAAQDRRVAAATGMSVQTASAARQRVELRWDAQAGTNVIGRAIAAGVIGAGDRQAELARCLGEPGYQRGLEQRIADAGGFSALPPSQASPEAAAVAASQGRVSSRHRNPLAAAAMARTPRVAARAADPAPTLFATGDLPPFTASGIDPQVLLSVPWQVRHAVASAPSQAEAYQMLQDYSGADAEDAAALEHGGDWANEDYARRVREWEVAGLSEDQAYVALFGDDAAPGAGGA